MVDFTLPAYTAMSVLSMLKLRYGPQLVVSSSGSDPITVARLLNTYSGGAVHGYGLIDGAITDAFLPSPAETSNPWIRLFRKVDTQYDNNVPLTTNVEYGMASAYTLVQALRAAGPNLTRQALIDAINQKGSSWRGPGLVPLHYSTSDHSGFKGAQLGLIQNGHLVLFGSPLTTTSRAGSPVVSTKGPSRHPRRTASLALSRRGSRMRDPRGPHMCGPTAGACTRRGRGACTAAYTWYSTRLITCAGAPAAIEYGGMSEVTTELAPITAREPIVTPLVTTT